MKVINYAQRWMVWQYEWHVRISQKYKLHAPWVKSTESVFLCGHHRNQTPSLIDSTSLSQSLSLQQHPGEPLFVQPLSLGHNLLSIWVSYSIANTGYVAASIGHNMITPYLSSILKILSSLWATDIPNLWLHQHLEYACSVWDSHLKATERLESIQK